MPKLYLIDGNAYIHRAYHALPPMSTSKGEPVNAVYGFTKMLLKLIDLEKPEYLVVCFDFPAPTFRHKEYPQYKAHRKESDDELKSQMPLAREAVRALNVPIVEKKGYEADDLIATLARSAQKDKAEVVIVTGDKDIFQLVNSSISVWNEQKGILFDPKKVEEKYGIKAEQLVDMFALMGDASDNIPGVRGIGPKTAVKLIQEYGTLDKVLENAASVKGKTGTLLASSKEDALKSRMLVTLDEDVPLDISWKECGLKSTDESKVIEFIKRFEFSSLLKNAMHRTCAPVESGQPQTQSQAQNQNQDDGFKTKVVLSETELSDFIKKLSSSEKVSLDLETTSLDTFSAKIVGLSFSFDCETGYYIPVGHSYLGVPDQLEEDKVLKALKPALEDPKIKKYGQNIKYDLLVLKQHGINLTGVYFDSMIAAYCLNPTRPSVGLKNLALEVLGYRMTHIEELIGQGKKQVTMDTVEIEKSAEYAACDAVMVMRLADVFEKELTDKKLDKLFYELEMPLVEIISSMEHAGIKVDAPYLKQLSREFEALLGDLEKRIYASAGQEFNANSPKQLAFILFEKLGLPVIKRTKTGNSTNEEVLNTLAPQHELPKLILENRELQKLKSTYIDALLELIEPSTGRVHTSFNQAVTATGRFSSSDPNLQNIPVRSEHGRSIRKGFIAEPGCVLVSADYSQIDLRSMAHISKDIALIEAFKQGEDIHTITAQEVFGNADKESRGMAKAINFGIIYGQSAYGLANQLDISNSEAKDYIDSYFLKYSGVKTWMENIVQQARRDGYVSTLLGRIRYIPEINAKNGQVRGFGERTALNTPIQGTSADILKAAMINVDLALSKGEFKTRMLLQVHDELIFEVPESELAALIPLIKSTMETAVTLDVPIVVDVKSGKNWNEMQAQA